MVPAGQGSIIHPLSLYHSYGPRDEITAWITSDGPAIIFPSQDFREWREKVCKWADIIKAAQDSGIVRLYQAMINIIGQNMCTSGLPREKQSM